MTYESLANMQNFYIKEYALLNLPFTKKELKDFITQLNKYLLSLDKEFGDRMKNYIYINTFISHVICYIKNHINSNVMLDMKNQLSKSHGYSPIDY